MNTIKRKMLNSHQEEGGKAIVKMWNAAMEKGTQIYHTNLSKLLLKSKFPGKRWSGKCLLVSMDDNWTW